MTELNKKVGNEWAQNAQDERKYNYHEINKDLIPNFNSNSSSQIDSDNKLVLNKTSSFKFNECESPNKAVDHSSSSLIALPNNNSKISHDIEQSMPSAPQLSSLDSITRREIMLYYEDEF